jgi:hypothetical protein
VNHIAPSEPGAIENGWLPGVGSGNSVVEPVVVMRAILFPRASVNHIAPSGPAAIPTGLLRVVEIGN